MYQRANALMRSPKAKAFDLSQVPAATRAAYGNTSFGEFLLIARRLVEAGVKYVEVVLDSWDTHTDNFKTTQEPVQPGGPGDDGADQRPADSGRLDSTLVICMGEFGRSPGLGEGGGDGRGHYAKAWTTVLAGAGLKTGQVVGRTDAPGGAVTDRSH